MAKNNLMGKADKLLSQIDQESLKKGIEKLKNMSDTESAKLKKQLDSIDKDKVLDMLGTLTPQQIKAKMQNLDLSKLNTDALNQLKKGKK
ncbi:MAG TPA: hypothetical protein IAC74_06690 [Candidatus Aphodoplasma excrementigallinarum]|uniref:Uncharacterized protein n=1 Tax=Candidatus Aphodoplasma excrementigallinarum TaxID=2840673 RepID=A0A9D1NI16_9FIRM|nr:hypothetical protein [Candidatus Aphodoplasma excrementigallinarum]